MMFAALHFHESTSSRLVVNMMWNVDILKWLSSGLCTSGFQFH